LGRYRDATYSAGLEDVIDVTDRLSLVPGVSLNARRTLRAESFDKGETYPERTNRLLDVQVAALYQLPDAAGGPLGGGQLSASLARKSRFPTIKDRYSYRLGRALPNPALAPEHALHAEVGYDGPLAGVAHAQVSLFYSRLADVIQQVSTENGEGQAVFQLQNTGRARHLGAELGVSARLASFLTGEATYTYLDQRNLDDPDRKFTDTPAHAWRARLEASPFAGLTASGQATYNSSRYTLLRGGALAEIDGFLRLDLEAGYAFPQGVQVEAGLHNVLDTGYQLDAGFPAPGRTAFARLTYTLGR